MRRCGLLAASLALALAEFGCARPDKVDIFKSPTDGVFLTVEAYDGHGPLSPDITKVYAHFEHNGKAKKIVVLAGEELTVRKIIWNTPNDATLCLGSGYTDTFRNDVTLILGDNPEDSETIRTHLDEHCP